MQNSRWQQELREVVRERVELLTETDLSEAGLHPPRAGGSEFPVRVPRPFLQRIRKNRPDDPLLRQILPLADEDLQVPGFSTDPVGEYAKHSTPGLIQKYPGRVLLVTTGVCAIHCRYCFRRHYPYSDNQPGRDNWAAALASIRADQTLHEVILSGGDPLSLSDEKLGSLIHQLADIPHLRWLRIHTRMPVVLPARVTPGLIEALTGNRLRQTMVIHVNHANEIDAEVTSALHHLHKSGLQLLNQSVLLRGVNDHADILHDLSERLHENRVLPYYLHMLDPVAGAAHFAVEETVAQEIMQQLRSTLPGYLVPRLVREMQGRPFKTPVDV